LATAIKKSKPTAEEQQQQQQQQQIEGNYNTSR